MTIQEQNKEHFDKGTAQFGWNYDNSCGYKCQCGNELSPATMKFFNYDFDRAKCYKCQEQNI